MTQLKSLFAFTLIAVAVPLCNGIAITCTTTTTTLETLIDCLNGYTVPEDAYSCAGYASAQPQTTPNNEVTGWTAAVTQLLNSAGSCSLPAGSTISGSYLVTDFLDTASGRRYCVLSEKDYVTVGSSNRFTRGWGTFVAPRDVTGSTLTVHHSAPHPLADTNTPQQAAAVFRRTNSRSLLITGRHRNALSATSAPSPCAIDSCVSSDYTKTDPAHESVSKSHQLCMRIILNVGHPVFLRVSPSTLECPLFAPGKTARLVAAPARPAGISSGTERALLPVLQTMFSSPVAWVSETL